MLRSIAPRMGKQFSSAPTIRHSLQAICGLFPHGSTDKPVPFQKTKFNEGSGQISRDGKWVAFVSDESGENEVYIKPLSAPASDPWKVSNGGGEFPVWGPTSNE